MKLIQKGYKHEETFPLPCSYENGVLKYSEQWAGEMVCKAYGHDTDNYYLNKSTLELYYQPTKKLRFKVAEVNYESYFTDIKGTDWEQEWLDMYGDIEPDESPEDYEMYNLTLYHYDHPSLRSLQLNKKNKLNGINTEEYIQDIMEEIEREDKKDDDDFLY